MFKACKLIPNPTTVQTDEGGGEGLIGTHLDS